MVFNICLPTSNFHDIKQYNASGMKPTIVYCFRQIFSGMVEKSDHVLRPLRHPVLSIRFLNKLAY